MVFANALPPLERLYIPHDDPTQLPEESANAKGKALDTTLFLECKAELSLHIDCKSACVN